MSKTTFTYKYSNNKGIDFVSCSQIIQHNPTYLPTIKKTNEKNVNGITWMVGRWLAEPYKPSTCRLN